jgi:2'-5' RNA ligase
MARMRLGVVLMVPEPVDREVDGLRRACGDPALERVASHLTLVPPVNVRPDRLGEALTLLREQAARTLPLELTLGPPETFLPASPTLYLGVHPAASSLDDLLDLRSRIFRPPLERPLTWPFVPHVTLADGIDVARIESGVDVLRDYQRTVRFDRLHLLEEQRVHGHHVWMPIADHPFEAPSVVGRGGLEVEITVTDLPDPEVSAFVAAHADPAEEPTAAEVFASGRRRGVLVGVAAGRYGDDSVDVDGVVVDPAHRGEGIARHLVAALESYPRRQI